MTLPALVREAVEAALESRTGHRSPLRSVERLGGGCVSPVARVTGGDGTVYFLKWSAPGHPEGLLAAEARGLALLAATRTVRVPEVLATPRSGDGWLLLEWIEPGPHSRAAWDRLGRDLAALHRTRGARFGDERDNFIGTLPQANAPMNSWAGFWRDRRLAPQLERACGAGAFGGDDRRRFDRLLDRLDALLSPGEDEGPSVLHGDLWSGNVHIAASGPPAVVDPAAYQGHREVDLAMSELFGGFGRGFREAYEEVWPVEPGYEPVRRAVYQLYYLLVHVNLFGAGYVSGCRRALQEAGV